MNVDLLEFSFTDFEFVTLLQYMAKTFAWYLSSWKQFVREIRKINPTLNLRLLQYFLEGWGYNVYMYMDSLFVCVKFYCEQMDASCIMLLFAAI